MKKEYLEPQMEVLTITEQQMLAFSGGTTDDGATVDPTPDYNEGPNLSRMPWDSPISL